jgi:hypothetical protein
LQASGAFVICACAIVAFLQLSVQAAAFEGEVCQQAPSGPYASSCPPGVEPGNASQQVTHFMQSVDCPVLPHPVRRPITSNVRMLAL